MGQGGTVKEEQSRWRDKSFQEREWRMAHVPGGKGTGEGSAERDVMSGHSGAWDSGWGPVGPLKVPSDAVSEKSKNGSIFIRKVLPNFHPLAGFGLRPGQLARFSILKTLIFVL